MPAPFNPALTFPDSSASRLGHFKHGALCICVFYGIKYYSANNTHACFSCITSSPTERDSNVWCSGTPIIGINLSWPHETASGILVFLDPPKRTSVLPVFFQPLLPLFPGNISTLPTWLGSLSCGQKLLRGAALISIFPLPKCKRWEIATGAAAPCHLHDLMSGHWIMTAAVTSMRSSSHDHSTQSGEFQPQNQRTVFLADLGTYPSRSWSVPCLIALLPIIELHRELPHVVHDKFYIINTSGHPDNISFA